MATLLYHLFFAVLLVLPLLHGNSDAINQSNLRNFSAYITCKEYVCCVDLVSLVDCLDLIHDNNMVSMSDIVYLKKKF